MGKQYQHLCNMQAISLLLEHYKDKYTREKVVSNLNLIDESTNLKTINSRITKYKKILSKEASSVYYNIVNRRIFI